MCPYHSTEITDISVAPDSSDVVGTKEIEAPSVDQSVPDAVSAQSELSPLNEAPTSKESTPDDQITDVKDPSREKMDQPDTIITTDMSDIVPTGPMVAVPINFDGDTLITPDISKEPAATELDTNIPNKPEVEIPIDIPVPPVTVGSGISDEPTTTEVDIVSSKNTSPSEQDISLDTELFTPADMDSFEKPIESSTDTVSTPNDAPATVDLDTTSSDTSSTPNILEEPTETKLDSANTPNVSELDVLTETVPVTSDSNTPEITELTDTVGIPNTAEPEDSTDITKDISSDGDTSTVSLDTVTTPKILEEPTITNLDQVSMPNPSEIDVPADSMPDISIDDTPKTTSDTPEISDEPSESTLDIQLDIPTDTKPDMSVNTPDLQSTSKSDIEVMPKTLDTPNNEDKSSKPGVSSTSDQNTLGIEETVGISSSNTESTSDVTEKSEKDENTLESTGTPVEPNTDTTSSVGQDEDTQFADGQQSPVNSDKRVSESVAEENFNRNNGISSTDSRCDFDVDEFPFEYIEDEPEDSVITPEEDKIIGELDRNMIESIKADQTDFSTKYETPVKVKNCICSTSKDFDFIEQYEHDREIMDFIASSLGRLNNKYHSIARKLYDDDFVNVEHFIEE